MACAMAAAARALDRAASGCTGDAAAGPRGCAGDAGAEYIPPPGDRRRPYVGLPARRQSMPGGSRREGERGSSALCCDCDLAARALAAARLACLLLCWDGDGPHFEDAFALMFGLRALLSPLKRKRKCWLKALGEY